MKTAFRGRVKNYLKLWQLSLVLNSVNEVACLSFTGKLINN